MPITATRRAIVAGEDLRLGCDVTRHPAMAVEMVGRDVEQHGDPAGERGRQLELVGRKLEHVAAVMAERRQAERGLADIAAGLDALSGRA